MSALVIPVSSSGWLDMSVAARNQLIRGTIVSALIPVLSVGAQSARSAPSVEAAYVNTPIRLDGRLDEPVWRAVKSSNRFIQREPAEGLPATFPTDVRMLVTDDAVIIGVSMRDDKNALLGVGGPPSDGANGGYLSDYFEVEIDPHRDHNTALALVVAPSGGRRSWLVTRDGTRDASWDIHWEAATHVDANGWSAEIRIPLTEFHVKRGSESWGVQFTRFSWRRQETDVLEFVPTRMAERPVQRP